MGLDVAALETFSGWCNSTLSVSNVVTGGIAGSIPFRGDSVFTIADYGTADGGTSMLLMRECIGNS